LKKRTKIILLTLISTLIVSTVSLADTLKNRRVIIDDPDEIKKIAEREGFENPNNIVQIIYSYEEDTSLDTTQK